MSINQPIPLNENDRRFLAIAQSLINEVKAQQLDNRQFKMDVRQKMEEMNTRLESEVVIVPIQAHELKREVAARVRHFLQTDADYAKFKSKLYSAIWRDLKNAFRVAEYREIPRVKFKAAMEYVKSWYPSEELLQEAS